MAANLVPGFTAAMLHARARRLIACALAVAGPLATRVHAQPSRPMTPADLFRVERVGAVAWSPDGRRATVEIRRPGRWLDGTLPTNALHLLDATAGTLVPLRAPDVGGGGWIGFFGAAWSPDGRRLLFLGLDTSGVVRPWLWDAATRRARLVPGLALRHGIGDPAAVTWASDTHALLLVVDSAGTNAGPLHFRVTRGRNAADAWARARAGDMATATVLESGGAADSTSPMLMSRVIRLDTRTGSHRALARGAIHRLRLSPDRRTLAFFEERPGVPGARVAPYFATRAGDDDLYDRMNWGGTLHVVDAASGAALAPAVDLADPDHATFRWRAASGFILRERDASGTARWLGIREGRIAPLDPPPHDTLLGRSDAGIGPRDPAPSMDARLIGASPTGSGLLYAENDVVEGTRLWLARPGIAPLVLWRGNAWVREVRTGRMQAIAYTATDGRPLTGWLLLPPGHVPGTRIPIVTVVYPGTMLDASAPPTSFSPFVEHFQHPQLFAALGYGVLVPSMPEAARPLAGDAIAALSVGVLPLVDTVVARGIADSTRIALLGQSAGGWATLGLVTVTTRFRSAIASASYADLVSLYGTFTGQHRHGDGGHPQAGQLSRMLQLERGWFGAGAPPWEVPRRYLDNSPLLRVQQVRTPVMLVHGALDFIPVQQAEEFFTALHRQDKRARLVRYDGEWHTISARANVLDLWTRMEQWLRETMAVP